MADLASIDCRRILSGVFFFSLGLDKAHVQNRPTVGTEHLFGAHS